LLRSVMVCVMLRRRWFLVREGYQNAACFQPDADGLYSNKQRLRILLLFIAELHTEMHCSACRGEVRCLAMIGSV
jgi:hypothetical protein